jgi:hypothetical protein
MTLCDVANQNRGHTQIVLNPSNIRCNLVLTHGDVFFKIFQEREVDIITSKLFFDIKLNVHLSINQ